MNKEVIKTAVQEIVGASLLYERHEILWKEMAKCIDRAARMINNELNKEA